MTSAETKTTAADTDTATSLKKQQETIKNGVAQQRRRSNPQVAEEEEKQHVHDIVIEPVNFEEHAQNHMHGATPDGHHPGEDDLNEDKRNFSTESFARAFIRRNISKPMLNVVKKSRRGGRRPGKRTSDAEQSEDKLEVDEVSAGPPSRGSSRRSSTGRPSSRSSLVLAAEEDDMFF